MLNKTIEFISILFMLAIVIWVIMKKSARSVATVMTIVSASSAFGFMMAVLRVPDAVTHTILAVSENPIIVLLLMNLILLVLGLFIDMVPMILITTPILMAIATSMGMHPVQFGIVLLLNLGISLITPPVGAVLFVGCAVGKTQMEAVIRPILPYYVVMLMVLLLITFIPQLSMWLPGFLNESLEMTQNTDGTAEKLPPHRCFSFFAYNFCYLGKSSSRSSGKTTATTRPRSSRSSMGPASAWRLSREPFQLRLSPRTKTWPGGTVKG